MGKRQVYHVVGKKGSWDVKPQGAGHSISHQETKEAALDVAKSVGFLDCRKLADST